MKVLSKTNRGGYDLAVSTIKELYATLEDLRSSSDGLKWNWASILSDDYIEKIVNRLPYTERMLDFVLPIDRTTKPHSLLAGAIVTIIEELAPKIVFQTEAGKEEYIVFKSGNTYTVNTADMDCSCGINLYRKGSKDLNGMCPHIAKVIAARESDCDKELFLDNLALIKYHARKNTEESMDDYRLLHSFIIEGKQVNLYDASRFIYVTFMGDTSSYYRESYTWCWDCHIEPDDMRLRIEGEILAFLGYPMPHPIALTFQATGLHVDGVTKNQPTSFLAFPIINDGSIFKGLVINVNFRRIENKTVDIEVSWGGRCHKAKRKKQDFTLEIHMFNKFPNIFSECYLKLIESWVLTCLQELKSGEKIPIGETKTFAFSY